MNHRRTTTPSLAHVVGRLWLLMVLLFVATSMHYVHAGGDEALAALFCEGSSKVRTEKGELYPCWTDEDDDSKSRRRGRNRRLNGKGGSSKKDECEIIEMDGEDSFDDFKNFEGVSTYLIECGKDARAGICTEDGDDYEAEEECDNGDAAVITILYLDDYRRGRHLGRSGDNNEVDVGDDVGEASGGRRRRRSLNTTTKKVDINGKTYTLLKYDK